jgi:acyl-phosphate glycerol 3-phosphate acyltransferase
MASAPSLEAVMNNSLFILIMIAIYLIAAIPTGVVLARLMGGEDVRQKGSGNIGATNVYRVAGKLAGVLTLVGDTLKGFLPLLGTRHFLGALTQSSLFRPDCLYPDRSNNPIYLSWLGIGSTIRTLVDSAPEPSAAYFLGHALYRRTGYLAT